MTAKTLTGTLDLRDIGFVSSTEATYKGGVLTVTDGTHTAHITLGGNFLGTTFVASSDGSGGTDVVAQATMVEAASAHNFISAMAALGGQAAGPLMFSEPLLPRETPLSLPGHATT